MIERPSPETTTHHHNQWTFRIKLEKSSRGYRISSQNFSSHRIPRQHYFFRWEVLASPFIGNSNTPGKAGNPTIGPTGHRIRVMHKDGNPIHPRSDSNRYRGCSTFGKNSIRHKPEEMPQGLETSQRKLKKINEIHEREIAPPLRRQNKLGANPLLLHRFFFKRPLRSDKQKLHIPLGQGTDFSGHSHERKGVSS